MGPTPLTTFLRLCGGGWRVSRSARSGSCGPAAARSLCCGSGEVALSKCYWRFSREKLRYFHVLCLIAISLNFKWVNLGLSFIKLICFLYHRRLWMLLSSRQKRSSRLRRRTRQILLVTQTFQNSRMAFPHSGWVLFHNSAVFIPDRQQHTASADGRFYFQFWSRRSLAMVKQRSWCATQLWSPRFASLHLPVPPRKGWSVGVCCPWHAVRRGKAGSVAVEL